MSIDLRSEPAMLPSSIWFPEIEHVGLADGWEDGIVYMFLCQFPERWLTEREKITEKKTQDIEMLSRLSTRICGL